MMLDMETTDMGTLSKYATKDGIVVVSHKITMPHDPTFFYIVNSCDSDHLSPLHYMKKGFVGFLTDDMSKEKILAEMKMVNITVEKLSRFANKSTTTINFQNDLIAFIMFEHFLNNSLLRQDDISFAHCLSMISQHTFTQRYPAIINRLKVVANHVINNHLSLYQFTETMELLQHHIFYPANNPQENKLLA